MPILLKNVEANIISLFSNIESGGLTAPIYLIQSVNGSVGIEYYINLVGYEAFTQDFSKIINSYFYTPPTSYGLSKCDAYTELNISY